jgi:hypothetical protein
MVVQTRGECTPAYLSTGLSNLLQPAQADVVLGQLSTYLASWVRRSKVVFFKNRARMINKQANLLEWVAL